MTYFEMLMKINYSRVLNMSNFWYKPKLHYIAKYFSVVVSPALILLGVSPNAVTIFSFVVSLGAVVGIAFAGVDNLYIPVSLFLLFHWLFDFVDGDMARVQNSSTFLGRWMDGMSGILLYGLVYISFGFLLFRETQNPLWLLMGSLVGFITGIGQMNVDRYSAYRRWIKEEQGIDIGTHELTPLFSVMSTINFDLYVGLIFVAGFFYSVNVVILVLVVGLIWSSMFFYYYSSLIFKSTSSIVDKPKHDGTGKLR
ncbi:MAG: CDP-alcohol phosphatidyltransferase family protein [Thermoplasmata archaeon]|nr:MAG: CDP-alcohol phosphatidyltransferase family protein [Thermoplasmata archaeon]